MLSSFRKTKGSFVGKIILIILIASLVSVSIVGIFAPNKDYVVKVGNRKVNPNDFYQQYISQTNKDKNANKELIKQQLLNELIEKNLILAEADNLGLEISNQFVFEEIRKMGEFINDEGKFDINLYNKLVPKDNEQRFFDEISNQMRFNLILNSFMDISLESDKLNKIMYDYFDAKKIFQVLKIYNKNIKIDQNIDDKELEEFYNKNKNQFKTTEKRDIKFFVIDGKDNIVKVDQDDLIKEFNKRKSEGEYKSDKQYVVTVVYFNEKENAEKFLQYIKNNRNINFKNFAKNSNLKVKTEDFNDIFASNLDEFVMYKNYIKNLKPKEYSEVIDSGFGYNIVYLDDIRTVAESTFDDVKYDLKAELEKELAENKIADTKDLIQDEIDGGISLLDLAKEYGYSSNDIEEVTGVEFQQGTEGYEKISILFPYNYNDYKIIDNIFTTNVNDDLVLMSLNYSKLLVFDVTNINEGYIPKLDTIKEQVITKLLEQKKKEALYKYAENILSQLKKINNLNKIGNLKINKNIIGYKLMDNVEVTRMNFNNDIDFVDNTIVNIKKLGISDKLFQDNEGNILIVNLKEINNQVESDSDLDFYNNKEKYLWFILTFNKYIEWLKTKYEININKSLLDRIQ